jgi:hypothetical protein
MNVMPYTSVKMSNRANYVTADSCGNRRRALRLNAAVMQKTRDVFPLKTAQYLAEITGYSLRTCEYWLSEKVVIPSDALAALIQSEWGRDYLAAVMTDTTPKWWLQLKAYLRRITYEAAAARQERQYKEMLDEEAKVWPHRPTPMFQDDAFYEGQPSPLRAVAAARRRVK